MTIRILFASLLTGVALSGCHGGAVHSGGDGHDHDDNVMITAYNDGFELFAEATPMAAGEKVEVLAHFTHLNDFKPLEEGRVTATLSAGGSSASQTLDAPVRPGIYKFELTPEKAGEAEMTFDISTPEGQSRITASGLKVYADEHEAEHAAEDTAPKSSNAVVFTKEMSWKVDFSTAPAALRPMGTVIRTMAQVQPSQGDVRTVTAKNSGVVAYASANLTDGQSVGAGQVLFTVDGSGMAGDNLKVTVLEAKNDFETARLEYERKTALAKEKLVTESELLRAKQEYDNAAARYDNLRKGFAAGGGSVASPIGGYITQLFVTNGEYVEAGQPLASVAQNRDLCIKAEVQPSRFEQLSAIKGATVRRPNSDIIYGLEELGGSVVSYGKSVDNDNPLLPVVFRVNNVAGLVPGSFVEMFITTGTETPVIAVPNQSLVEEMGNYFVYVQLTPEYFEKREVKTGRTDGRYTEILQGLDEDERVVAKGAVLVKLAHSSGTLDAHSGHVH